MEHSVDTEKAIVDYVFTTTEKETKIINRIEICILIAVIIACICIVFK